MIRFGIHPSAIIDCQGELDIPDDAVIEPGVVIYIGARGRLRLGRRNTIYANTTIRIDQGYMETGDEVSFGTGVQIYEPRAGLEIGHYCMIGGGVVMAGSIHEFGRIDVPIRNQPQTAGKIVLEDDVALGMGSVVLPNVTIGKGAFIGAGCVVSRSIPPYAVARGRHCEVEWYRNDPASKPGPTR